MSSLRDVSSCSQSDHRAILVALCSSIVESGLPPSWRSDVPLRDWQGAHAQQLDISPGRRSITVFKVSTECTVRSDKLVCSEVVKRLHELQPALELFDSNGRVIGGEEKEEEKEARRKIVTAGTLLPASATTTRGTLEIRCVKQLDSDSGRGSNESASSFPRFLGDASRIEVSFRPLVLSPPSCLLVSHDHSDVEHDLIRHSSIRASTDRITDNSNRAMSKPVPLRPSNVIAASSSQSATATSKIIAAAAAAALHTTATASSRTKAGGASGAFAASSSDTSKSKSRDGGPLLLPTQQHWVHHSALPPLSNIVQQQQSLEQQQQQSLEQQQHQQQHAIELQRRCDDLTMLVQRLQKQLAAEQVDRETEVCGLRQQVGQLSNTVARHRGEEAAWCLNIQQLSAELDSVVVCQQQQQQQQQDQLTKFRTVAEEQRAQEQLQLRSAVDETARENEMLRRTVNALEKLQQAAREDEGKKEEQQLQQLQEQEQRLRNDDKNADNLARRMTTVTATNTDTIDVVHTGTNTDSEQQEQRERDIVPAESTPVMATAEAAAVEEKDDTSALCSLVTQHESEESSSSSGSERTDDAASRRLQAESDAFLLLSAQLKDLQEAHELLLLEEKRLRDRHVLVVHVMHEEMHMRAALRDEESCEREQLRHQDASRRMETMMTMMTAIAEASAATAAAADVARDEIATLKRDNAMLQAAATERIAFVSVSDDNNLGHQQQQQQQDSEVIISKENPDLSSSSSSSISISSICDEELTAALSTISMLQERLAASDLQLRSLRHQLAESLATIEALKQTAREAGQHAAEAMGSSLDREEQLQRLMQEKAALTETNRLQKHEIALLRDRVAATLSQNDDGGPTSQQRQQQQGAINSDNNNKARHYLQYDDSAVSSTPCDHTSNLLPPVTPPPHHYRHHFQRNRNISGAVKGDLLSSSSSSAALSPPISSSLPAWSVVPDTTSAGGATGHRIMTSSASSSIGHSTPREQQQQQQQQHHTLFRDQPQTLSVPGRLSPLQQRIATAAAASFVPSGEWKAAADQRCSHCDNIGDVWVQRIRSEGGPTLRGKCSFCRNMFVIK